MKPLLSSREMGKKRCCYRSFLWKSGRKHYLHTIKSKYKKWLLPTCSNLGVLWCCITGIFCKNEFYKHSMRMNLSVTLFQLLVILATHFSIFKDILKAQIFLIAYNFLVGLRLWAIWSNFRDGPALGRRFQTKLFYYSIFAIFFSEWFVF